MQSEQMSRKNKVEKHRNDYGYEEDMVSDSAVDKAFRKLLSPHDESLTTR